MIGIHNSKGGFHPRWISWCEIHNIHYKLVNCYSNELIEQLKDCKALMWHHSQNDPKALVAAKPILFALEQAGLKVFPDFRTNWHFDDKLGQKYLLEALMIPIVPTYVFYEKNRALDWATNAKFPKVFKLRGGAGSSNVKLVKSQKDAILLIRKAFGKGFSNYDAWSNFREGWRKWYTRLSTNLNLLKSIIRLVWAPDYIKILGRESGYVYFQDFIPDNDHDIRIIIIGDKAFAIKRMVRKNDFRASGSGSILYDNSLFRKQDIQFAFKIHNGLRSQCTAMDFVFEGDEAKLVEISYGFDPKGYEDCPGYWDSKLIWHEGNFDPYGWMIELMINEHY